MKKKKQNSSVRHPIQPIVESDNGVYRFKENKIVSYILERGRQHGVDMNHLACMSFSQEDREQFAQLIGYSVSGAGDLSYMSSETIAIADKMAEALDQGKEQSEDKARIEYLQGELDFYRNELPLLLKEPMAKIFNKHPDDLLEEG